MKILHMISRRVQYRWHTWKTTDKIEFVISVLLSVVIIIGFCNIRPPDSAFGRMDGWKIKIEMIDPPMQPKPFERVYENPSVTRCRIKRMMVHAWRNYARFAWGANELRPISKRKYLGGVFGNHRLGASIIESLDTLHLMGLDEELRRSRNWINKKFSLDNVNESLSVFEVTSRLLGSMLTLYSLTGDDLYRAKAVHIADKILPAFDTPTGIPWRRVVPNQAIPPSKYFDTCSLISEYGALHLEFFYLSEITGSTIYKDRVETIRQRLNCLKKVNNLYPNSIDIKTGEWGSLEFSMNRYYDYLLKSWIQSGRTDVKIMKIYKETMLAVVNNMVHKSPKGLTYISEIKRGTKTNRMSQMACFSGGLFHLGAAELKMKHWEIYSEIGVEITDSCHSIISETATHLGPEVIGYSLEAEKEILSSQLMFYYNLRPEVIESYFLLYRLSHDEKYRAWGLEVVAALEKHCWTSGGFTGIMNVYLNTSEYDDVQQSFFLGSTLKYLYLLFSGSHVLPLHQWVFNSRGHFLPIKGANDLYRLHNSTKRK